MRKALAFICLLAIVIFTSCNKTETNPEPDSGLNFQFTSLVAADTVLKVNDITTITAQATGNGLTYKWTASYGTFIGSGSSVQWTVCHRDKFTINCEVTDEYNHSETKSVIVRTQ